MSIEPITREEKMLSAIAKGTTTDIAPITREEMFLARAGGADIETPEPVTRKEMFLSQISGGGGGGGSDDGWIGDGNTHIWIRLSEGRTSPKLGCCPNGTVTVDWGDGSAKDVLRGGGTSDVMWTPTHNYEKPGDYIITLVASDTIGFRGHDNVSYILRDGTEAGNRNFAYLSAVKRVEIGNFRAPIFDYAFAGLSSLTNAIVPNLILGIYDNAFYGCSMLANVTIQDGVRHIDYRAFHGCSSLWNVFIPKSVTLIEGEAFAMCSGVRYYDFSTHTSVPTLEQSSAFSRIAADCEIRVPAALYDEWKAATNWSAYAGHIVAV